MKLTLTCTEINGMLLTTGSVLFRIMFSDKTDPLLTDRNLRIELHTLDPGAYEIGKTYCITINSGE